MPSKALEELGLSPNEAKVYEALLDLGISSIDKLAVQSQVHRRNVYDSVEKLVAKGLASPEFREKKRLFKATDPQRLLALVREREALVESVLPGLQRKFRKAVAEEEAVIYRGFEGVKNYLNDLLDVGEPAYFLAAKGYWLHPKLKYFTPKFDRERVKRGIETWHLFDQEVKTKCPEILGLQLNHYRFMPEGFGSPGLVDFFGDHVYLFHVAEDNPVQFKIVSKPIAESFRTYFKFMWRFAEKGNE